MTRLYLHRYPDCNGSRKYVAKLDSQERLGFQAIHPCSLSDVKEMP